ncbi:hypothetical protein C8Q80DRAFT_1153578 [Daedaleopsis nitida]|nr:hypothetical protein C8Q80DRAFT_1153578 [Daedaleopsis nitida]
MEQASTSKLSLPAFLKILTSNNVPPSKAITVAGQIYKSHNTPEQLGKLTDYSLESAGVKEKDLRRLVLAAVRKAGFKPEKSAGASASSSSRSAATSRSNTKLSEERKAKARKRKRDEDLNELLPDRPRQEGDSYGSLEFNEILDEEAIKPKSTVINRAPIMTAWAFVVAERLGFQREEALSIASVYTEMNARTKGVSLGIYAQGKQNGMEASRTGSQPYVELMGRRIPLYQTVTSQWRALSAGSPVAPTSAFSYITQALRQTAPHVVGALRLLAASYAPAELNAKGFSLYADFRPEADGWGQRGEVRCSTILGLRKARGAREGEGLGCSAPVNGTNASSSSETPSLESIVKVDPDGVTAATEKQDGEPTSKKAKLEAHERDEFDAALDDDALFDDFDLSTLP